MSPGRLHTDVLDLARAVLQGQHAVPARQAARMAALLARQALEDVIESLCGPELTRATMRTRLVYVRVLVNAEIADRAGVAWHGLSHACHHHAYELSPTPGEVEHLADLVSTLTTESR